MLFNVSFSVQIAISTYAQLSAVTSLRAFDVRTWLLSKMFAVPVFYYTLQIKTESLDFRLAPRSRQELRSCWLLRGV
jgi:hypothetical protein